MDNRLKKKLIFLGLIIILLWGAYVRINYLGESHLWIDETISASAAKQITEKGVPCYDSGYCYWRAYLFHYGMAFFMLIFKGEFGAKFISVVFGLLTIILAFAYGKKFIGTNEAGLIFATLIAFSVWEINYSKQARFYQAFQFFYFLSFYLFYKIVIFKEKISKNKNLDWILLSISTYITYNLQFMGIILLPLYCIIYSIEKDKSSTFHSKKYLGIFLLGIMAIIYIFNKINIDINIDRIELYLPEYTSFFFNQPLIYVITLLGLIIAYTHNKKFTISITLFSLIPLAGILILKVYASRYIYFLAFYILLLFTFLISKTKHKWIILITILLIGSPLFFDFNGVERNTYDFSMPSADYKGAYNSILKNESLRELPLVTTWSPATAYYYGNSDFQINYSLTGTSNSFWIYNKTSERFGAKKIINNQNQLPKSFISIEDYQSLNKIPPNKYNTTDCNIYFSGYAILVKIC